jgi:hypothetical protein
MKSPQSYCSFGLEADVGNVCDDPEGKTVPVDSLQKTGGLEGWGGLGNSRAGPAAAASSTGAARSK